MRSIFFIFIFVFLALTVKAQPSAPTNVEKHRIEGEFAVIQYEVTDGSATNSGVCYSTSTNPDATVDDSTVYQAISGAGTYQDSITGLDIDTKYYFKAYVTDGSDTSYSAEYSFPTQIKSQPNAITASTFTAEVSALDSGSIELNWDHPRGFDGFYVVRDTIGSTPPSINPLVDTPPLPPSWTWELTTSSPSANYTSLTGGTTYTFLAVTGVDHNMDTDCNLRQDDYVTVTATTIAGVPRTQADGISFTDITASSVTIQWTNGSGEQRLVFVNDSNVFNSYVADGNQYTADNTYSAGGAQCVYNGTGNSVTVSGIGDDEIENFYFKVFEVNHPTDLAYYNKKSATNNPVALYGKAKWNGSSGDSWSNSDNWSTYETPVSNQEVIIADASNNANLSSTESVGKVTIEAGGALTISSSGSLTVADTLSIESDASKLGSLLIDGGSLTTNGKAIYNRTLADDDNWHLVSSPVNNSNINAFLAYAANIWDEPNVQWVAQTDQDDINNMVGYNSTFASNNPNDYDKTMTFSSGDFNDGSMSIGVTNTNTSNSDYGWNLVGNPYPSAIDWALVSLPSGISPTVHVYDGSQYKTFSNSTFEGSDDARYIQACQGFFVEATVSSATLSLDNSVRLHSDKEFFKKKTDQPAIDEKKSVTLALTNGKFTDETYIVFFPGGTEGRDKTLEGSKLMGWKADVPEVYSLIDNGYKLAINTLSPDSINQLNDTYSVPIGFETRIDSTFTFSLKEFYQIPDSVKILFVDQETQDTVDLRKKGYQFSADSGAYDNRFELVFSKDNSFIEWTGNGNSQWNDTENWTGKTIPSDDNNVVIPSDALNQPVIESDGNRVNNLEIKDEANLEILAGAALTIQGDLTNNGTFQIYSDTAGSGSVITNGNINGTGQFYADQTLTAKRWWYLASPVQGATSELFSLDNNNRLFYWNEPESNWSEIESPTTLQPLKGYAYHKAMQGTTNKIFTGTFNTGEIGDLNNLTAEGSSKTGFNLIGNPYPSALNLGYYDSLKGISIQNLASTVWYRTNGQFATLNWVTGDGTNKAQPVVPPLQAFWVKVENAASGGITLTNNARVHPAHTLYKTPANNLLSLKVTAGDRTDETLIGVYPGALLSEDKYDSEKLFSNVPGLPEISSIIDQEKYAIIGIHNQKNQVQIPLAIRANGAESINIFTENINSFNHFDHVLLEDRYTGKITDLSEQNHYACQIDDGENSERFYLHLSKKPLAINQSTKKFYVYAEPGGLNVVHKATQGTISIYNILGQPVYKGELNNNGKTFIPINYSSQYYIVQITNEQDAYIQKIVVQ